MMRMSNVEWVGDRAGGGRGVEMGTTANTMTEENHAKTGGKFYVGVISALAFSMLVR